MRLNNASARNNFNSIKVQLELSTDAALPFIMAYFNSIKVQLEHTNAISSHTTKDIFQFHKGTIRTLFTSVMGVRYLISIP